MIENERRKHTRKQYAVLVDFTAPERVRPYQEYMDNISTGGMHIRLKDTIPNGTHLSICFEMPGRIPVKVKGAVVNSDKRGMGIEFLPGSDKRLGTMINMIW